MAKKIEISLPTGIEQCVKNEHSEINYYAEQKDDSTQHIVKWCKVCGAVWTEIKGNNDSRQGTRINKVRSPRLTEKIEKTLKENK